MGRLLKRSDLEWIKTVNGVKNWSLKTLNNKGELGELKESTIYNISVISRIQNTEFTAWNS